MISTPSSADYIIVGGGTAGLVVANRLSEDPNIHVIVLESGPDCTTDPRVQDPKAWPTLQGSDLDWQLKTAPQPGFNNREQTFPSGKVLGGSAAINGLAYLPPSPASIDAWSQLGNSEWNWDSLLPYMHKSYTVSAPDAETCKAMNVNLQTTGSGPIQVSYPTLAAKTNHALLQAWTDAFRAQGYECASDLLSEKKTVGPRHYSAVIDPKSGLRSSADGEYGTPAAKRPNVEIVTGAHVRRIVFSTLSSALPIATGVEVCVGGHVLIVDATKEVILAAGALHTPKLLELSGVGDKEVLDRLGIPQVIDSPGVGENLQNHVLTVLPVPLSDIPEATNAVPGIQATAFVRLDAQEQAEVLAHVAPSGHDHDRVIRSVIEQPDEASALVLLMVAPGNLGVLVVIPCFPLSRGNTHINTTDPNAQPTIDPKFFSQELDLEVMARHVQRVRELPSAPAIRRFFKTPDLEAMDLSAIKESLRSSAQTAHHYCGTASMLPREKGGVVDQNLRVYGTPNVRVVDASVFPLIPHANPLATVYAVAERAAQVIANK
ncbi:uncharacterized protein PFLUO_LOCUS2042 [Penicillium psychrofluorescens]|uniref:uncharacterized protein n=1 Tax=Penicillium psychrofluorescens TaxID=3158075 RepID=UPI003CCD77C1